MKVKELREIAKELKIKGYNKMKKGDLMAAIAAAEEPVLEGEDPKRREKQQEFAEMQKAQREKVERVREACRRWWKWTNHLFYFSQQIKVGNKLMSCHRCAEQGKGDWMPDNGICWDCGGRKRRPVTVKAARYWCIPIKDALMKVTRWLANPQTMVPEYKEIRKHMAKRMEQLQDELNRLNEIQRQLPSGK